MIILGGDRHGAAVRRRCPIRSCFDASVGVPRAVQRQQGCCGGKGRGTHARGTPGASLWAHSRVEEEALGIGLDWIGLDWTGLDWTVCVCASYLRFVSFGGLSGCWEHCTHGAMGPSSMSYHS